MIGRIIVCMKIIKVINNNVVSALDGNGEEVVIMGKGIGYGKKPGTLVDESRIEKRFLSESTVKKVYGKEKI